MVAIKDMEMPNCCFEVTTRPFYSDEIVYNYCPLYEVCKYKDVSRPNYKPSDCPLVEYITCGECKACEKRILEGKELLWCEREWCVTDEDYYCGSGERRE